jgi:hypothetical protein
MSKDELYLGPSQLDIKNIQKDLTNLEFDDKYHDDLKSVQVEVEMNKNDRDLKFDEKSNNHSDLGVLNKQEKKVLELNIIPISREKVYIGTKLYNDIKIEDRLLSLTKRNLTFQIQQRN